MDLVSIQVQLDTIAADESLHDPMNFIPRAEALALIQFLNQVMLKRWVGDQTETVISLRNQTKILQMRLEADNAVFVRRLREHIEAGCYTLEAIRCLFAPYIHCPSAWRRTYWAEGRYPGLDLLVDGLLRIAPVPEIARKRDSEMVIHQSTPVPVILDMMHMVAFASDDVFYDLGAGLGNVAILANLLTGVTTKGIEIEPAYCAYAEACAERLGLSNIGFISADAREVDSADGTVFSTTELGQNLRVGVSVDDMTLDPATVSVFPTGLTSAPLTVTLESGDHERTITMSQAGQIRVF